MNNGISKTMHYSTCGGNLLEDSVEPVVVYRSPRHHSLRSTAIGASYIRRLIVSAVGQKITPMYNRIPFWMCLIHHSRKCMKSLRDIVHNILYSWKMYISLNQYAAISDVVKIAYIACMSLVMSNQARVVN